MAKNVMYAQAGGVSAVINASAAGVIEVARRYPEKFGTIYAAQNGIVGVLEENLIDVTKLSEEEIDRLKVQPGAAFHACRYHIDEDETDQYDRILEVFKAYDIGYFFYNGGNGSMLTAKQVADYCTAKGHKVICIGVAKTIDNDIAMSHCSPGFGSAAKYVATSLLEATMDLYSMHNTSTKFFVLEAMGRNVGWLTIAGGLVKTIIKDVPLIVLPAERTFHKEKFLDRVRQHITEKGYCVCIVSEGLTDDSGEYVSTENVEHTRNHSYTQLGGVGSTISHIVADELGIKTHRAIPDYLQRVASHSVSETDWEMAYRAGKAAAVAAQRGEHGVLPVVEVIDTSPLVWRYKNVDLEEVADLEKQVPDEFISECGMDITDAAIDYLKPLIKGERHLHYKHGLPDIRPLVFEKVPKKLTPYKITK